MSNYTHRRYGVAPTYRQTEHSTHEVEGHSVDGEARLVRVREEVDAVDPPELLRTQVEHNHLVRDGVSYVCVRVTTVRTARVHRYRHQQSVALYHGHRDTVSTCHQANQSSYL